MTFKEKIEKLDYNINNEFTRGFRLAQAQAKVIACQADNDIHRLRAALTQSSFCLRELLPNDADAIFTVEIIKSALEL
jgi:hypothetical protein